MVLTIRFKGKEFGVNIPIMNINLFNSRYSTTGLHQYSSCCKARIRQKKVCEKCDEVVLNPDILKGYDENTILTDEQSEALKTFLDNGVLEVIDIYDVTETTFFDFMPYVTKSQIVMPCISKGYKRADVKAFYSFKQALMDSKKFCLGKLKQRGTEHLILLMPYKEELLLFYIPFDSYSNKEEIDRIQEGIQQELRLEGIEKPEEFSKQAEVFIKKFKGNVEREKITEEKAEFQKQMIKDIQNGKKPKLTANTKTNSNDKNPFC